jgi:hypothetical protein
VFGVARSSYEPTPPNSERQGPESVLAESKILHRAQKVLGTTTERETVEAALDMIAFRQELLDGTRALSGLKIDSIR